MKKLVKNLFFYFLLLCQKPLTWLILRNRERIKKYQAQVKNVSLSGMVSEFNLLHRILFVPFFRRVEVVSSDISNVKSLSGPIVYVMKNQGQLEYRYFNYLFLKEKIAPTHFATGSLTWHWLPFSLMWKHFVCWLELFYSQKDRGQKSQQGFEHYLKTGKNCLINLRITRDYIFGLMKSNPMESLKPLIELQKNTDKSIQVITIQFLYNKHPDKTELSYFDLLFGDKSQPGTVRKLLLFLINYRRKSQVKFGRPINLKEMIEKESKQPVQECCQKLLDSIEEDLRIEKARITGPKLIAKEKVIKNILNDKAFIEKVEEIAKKTKKKKEACQKDAFRYLNEIAAEVNYSYIHFAHITLRHVWTKIFDGVVVKHDQLTQVREVAGKNPVVLVPMHRSHIDYLLISDLFYEHNITFPHICSGINLNFWPVGKLIRKCGGFFIRRRFKGNDLYKESLYAYVKALIEHGHCLEFFIEGTRSRTGKQLNPKMGFLSMIMKSYFEGACDDVCFVPIAVNYDQILEEKAYQSENVGDDKKKENAGELLKVRRIFKKKYGKVYIEFAKPISLKSYCKKRKIVTAPMEELKNEVDRFGYYLTYHMTNVTQVTPVALVSLAVLSMNKKAFTYEQLIQQVEVLKEYLDHKDVIYSDLINYSESFAYHEAVKTLCHRGVLKEVESFEENFYTLEDKQRQEYDYYKNSIIHFFVLLTCFCKIINQKENGNSISLEEVLKQFERLKTLFRHDFIFSEKTATKDNFNEVIKFCDFKGFVSYDMASGLIQKTLTNQNQKAFYVFYHLLDNFLETLIVTLRYLKHNVVEGLDKKAFIKEILIKAKPMYLRDDLNYPEALSRFNMENSFKVLADMGILKITQQESGKKQYSSANDVDLINKWISSINQIITTYPAQKENNTVLFEEQANLSTQHSPQEELH